MPTMTDLCKNVPMPRRFCKIKLCKYESGTRDQNIRFFRVPRQGQIRKQWIKAISKHQEFDYYSLYYLVCHLHFKDDDFKMRKDKLVIKKNAVPSIFSPLDCHRGRKKPAMSTLSSEDAHESAMQNETGDCDEIEPISGDQYNFVSIPSHPLENQIKIECQPTIYDPVEMPSPSHLDKIQENDILQLIESNGDCKGCTHLQIELSNAFQRIDDLEKSLRLKDETLSNTKDTLNALFEENQRLKSQCKSDKC